MAYENERYMSQKRKNLGLKDSNRWKMRRKKKIKTRGQSKVDKNNIKTYTSCRKKREEAEKKEGDTQGVDHVDLRPTSFSLTT